VAIAYTLTVTDPGNSLGDNHAVLTRDIDFVVSLLGQYLGYQGILDLRVDVRPASENPFNTDGLLPSAPAWTVHNGSMTLAALEEAQTGQDINGAAPDAGFTIFLGNDGTFRNYGFPLWFDPDPQLGTAPPIPAGTHDFVSIVAHELLHCFGFASWPAQNAPWNQHTVESNGVWHFSSPQVDFILGGPLPLASLAGEAGDHVGSTSISYQPIRSDMMYVFGNYELNRWDLGQLDLVILQELGWHIQNYQDLPLVDPIDSANVIGTTGNDALLASALSSIVDLGAGDDLVELPAAPGNGNYLILGGIGNDTLVVNRNSDDFEIVPYGDGFILQSIQGTDGVTLLRSVEEVQFADRNIAIVLPPSVGNVLWRHVDGTVATTMGVLAEASSGWTIQATGDFEGDGDSDVLWRHRDGAVVTWELENAQLFSTHNIAFASTGWEIVGTGDFDDDTDSDVLWRHQDGAVVTWEMENGAYIVNHNIAFASTGWTIQGTGDFDGDGDSDVLWRHRDGAVVTWEMENGAYVQNHNIAFASTGWTIQGTGDFDADGDDDILWQHTQGAVVTWEIENGAYIRNHNIAVGPDSWQIAGTADFNDDGTDDILWRHVDGIVVTWEMSGGEILRTHNFGVTGNEWQIRGTGEFDLV
jgi:VCBS repeat protein